MSILYNKMSEPSNTANLVQDTPSRDSSRAVIFSIFVILTILLIHSMSNSRSSNKIDGLSVARTELPLQSHLYRTSDYPTEMQTSTWPTYLEVPRNTCMGGPLHLEPWDLWNPPKCGGRWFNG